MRFARWVFTAAGVWGLLVVPPLYFLFDTVGRREPPPITHPEYYYGFIAVTLAWQIAFLLIGAAPVRLRPVMLAAMVEKFLYVASIVTLFARHRASAGTLAFSGVDCLLGVLFVVAYRKTAGA